MMRKLLISILLVFFLLDSYSQEDKMYGTVVFYYTQRTPLTHTNPPSMFCLDSIRLISKNCSHPVLGDLVQNEVFVLERPQEFTADIYTKAVRSSPFYCENPDQNYVHSGGSIYEKKGTPDKIFIAFNVAVRVYKVSSSESILNDSIYSEISRRYNSFVKNEDEEPCEYFINPNDYIIITKLISAKKLTKFQIRKFHFTQSKISEFLRYGLW